MAVSINNVCVETVSPPILSGRLQAGRPQPIAHMRCRFRLARPTQQQLASRASGRLIFGRFPKALGFFRQPFFKGKFVLDAASFHVAILLNLLTHETGWSVFVCPVPDI
jgi:hypothetical protein